MITTELPNPEYHHQKFQMLSIRSQKYPKNMKSLLNLTLQDLLGPNTSICVIVEDKPNQLYPQGMRSFEEYDEICKYFAEGKQRDNDANEIQKHLQLYDLSLGEYLVNKYALLHETGRRIENASEGITLQIEKKKNKLGLSMLTFT